MGEELGGSLLFQPLGLMASAPCQLRVPSLKEEVLSLENCTREVAYLSLLHWDEPSRLVFQLDLQGKALAAGISFQHQLSASLPDLSALLSLLLFGPRPLGVTPGLAVAPVTCPVWCDMCIL